MASQTSETKAAAGPGTGAEKVGHPLLTFVPTTFHSFEEWRTRWEETTNLAEKLGLLHSLTTEGGWWRDPVLVSLLLDVADGYTDESNFTVQDECPFDGSRRRDNAKNRQAIAEKAFGVLCVRFFKDSPKDYEDPLWWWTLEEEALFQMVLWFLRPSRLGGKPHNCTWDSRDANTGHQQEVFHTFMRALARLGWEELRSKSGRHWDEATEETVKKRLDAARPQLIEVLDYLRELNWLNRQELDAASLEKLREIAMRESYHLPSTKGYGTNLRKPVGLEEAVLGGSVAAQVVLLHRVRERERRRLEALGREARRKAEAARRERERAEIAAQRTALDRKEEELARPSGKR